MKATRIFSTILIAGCLLILASMATTAAPDEEHKPTGDDLSAQVAQLQQRVVELEKHVADLRARGAIIQLDGNLAQPFEAPAAPMDPNSPSATLPSPPTAGPYVVPAPRSPHETRQLPRGASEGEINGMRFFIMPITGGDAANEQRD